MMAVGGKGGRVDICGNLSGTNFDGSGVIIANLSIEVVSRILD